MATILVSSCLLGLNCRYKGDHCANASVLALAKEHTLIPFCAEQAGGLPTPRDPAEIVGDRVITNKGRDVTFEYMKGAAAAVFAAQLNHVDFAILKSNSPSCGKGRIYDGTFTGNKVAGNGFTVRALLEAGIPVYSEEETDLLPL